MDEVNRASSAKRSQLTKSTSFLHRKGAQLTKSTSFLHREEAQLTKSTSFLHRKGAQLTKSTSLLQQKEILLGFAKGVLLAEGAYLRSATELIPLKTAR